MNRGDVYRSRIFLPDWNASDHEPAAVVKYCIWMNHFPGSSYVTTLIASRDKSERPPKRTNNYEVIFPPYIGEFPRWTFVDCRWLYAYPRSLFHEEDYAFSLQAHEVERLVLGVVNGLQF